MGRGQSQNPQGGQMGGMGQPGGIPGGGIASLAPQMGGQMGGFGQMVNQAVSQPGMVGATFDPQLGMGQPGMLGMGQVGGAPGMGPKRGMGGQMPRPQGGPPSTMVNPPRPMPGGQMQGGQMGGMGPKRPKRPMSPNVPSTMQRGMPQGIAAMFGGFR